MDTVVTTLTCPQCGAENPLPSGERLVRCAYCDATLFVDRSGLVAHYRLPRLLDAARAEAALKRWMAGNETVKHLDRDAQIESATPVAFPVWMFRFRTAAGESTRVEPAAPTPIPRLADLEIPAGKLEPYRVAEEGAETVAAQVPLETARGWFEQAGQAGDDSITETALVHVPLWRFVYRHKNASYTALVDGSTGAVLASVFPAKQEKPYWLVAGLGLVLFGIEGLLITNLFLKAVAYGITALPLTMMALWVARKV